MQHKTARPTKPAQRYARVPGTVSTVELSIMTGNDSEDERFVGTEMHCDDFMDTPSIYLRCGQADEATSVQKFGPFKLIEARALIECLEHVVRHAPAAMKFAKDTTAGADAPRAITLAS